MSRGGWLDLCHSAWKVHLGGATHVIEVAPVRSCPEPVRVVVAGGAAGSRLLRISRLVGYEVRCWRGGVLPDEGRAVGGPSRLSTDIARLAAVLELVHRVPTSVWGRDELGTGEMWNSDSVVAWLVAGTGGAGASPPVHGRAPGWGAGLTLARQSEMPAAAGGAGARRPTQKVPPPVGAMDPGTLQGGSG